MNDSLPTRVDQISVMVLPDRENMGKLAAERAIAILRNVLHEKGEARMIVASAPSQDEVIRHLVEADLDWSKITIFHMDEYIGLAADHPATFRAYQRDHLLSRVEPAIFHGIAGENSSPEEEAERYEALLAEGPIDLCCMGVGENGHIAFNDPSVADFQDERLVKPVELELACRQQQVSDGCFPDLASVPTHALTLTIPALCSARHLVCVVPGLRKAQAIRNMLLEPVAETCPASILRKHSSASLFLDRDAASLWMEAQGR
ncbi:MAG: glucosamine-6-phosphate deaminase [Puniceicoccales bacterium]